MEAKFVRGIAYAVIAAVLAVGSYAAVDSYRMLKSDVAHTEWMLANQQEQLTRMREQIIADKVTPPELRQTLTHAQAEIRLAAVQHSPQPAPLPLPLPPPLPGNAVERWTGAVRPARSPVRPSLRLPVAPPERPEAHEAEVALVDDSKHDAGKPMMNVTLLGEK